MLEGSLYFVFCLQVMDELIGTDGIDPSVKIKLAKTKAGLH